MFSGVAAADYRDVRECVVRALVAQATEQARQPFGAPDETSEHQARGALTPWRAWGASRASAARIARR